MRIRRLEDLTIWVCLAVLVLLTEAVLAANSGSACPTTLLTPKTNPTVSCPGGNCWGPGTKCKGTNYNPNPSVTATEWGWNPTLKKWVKTGATFSTFPGGVNTCMCWKTNENGDPQTRKLSAPVCCKPGYLFDGTGAKRVVTVGQCGVTGCPPGECAPSQVQQNPNNPDEEIIEDCT